MSGQVIHIIENILSLSKTIMKKYILTPVQWVLAIEYSPGPPTPAILHREI